ncbi:MAG TPA: excinuclease ABC subunit UvrA [Edaphocola sp.]|nr:excinuclease ABC subunit UvrA [Edaphocola sp.]
MAETMAKEKNANHPVPDSEDVILIQGARMHNLKDITVAIPRNKLVVVTGVSGSGKSSLTMDTLFAEGQRRYAESLSAYARQFLMRMDKPDVDFIKGICPAIAIEQKVTTRTPRSTVGSMTEIQDYLRLLFARIGKTYSPVSGKLVKKDEVSDVVDFIGKLPEGSRLQIIVPFETYSDRSFKEELNILLQKGFSRLLKIDRKTASPERIEDLLEQNEAQGKKTTFYLLIDRIVTRSDFDEDDWHRIADSIQTAFYESNGECQLYLEIPGEQAKITVFNNRFEADGIVFDEPTPNLFSFNNPVGACPVCEGFGQVLGIDEDLVIPDKRLSIYEDAVACWKGEKMREWKNEFIRVEGANGFPVHKPVKDLNDAQQKTLQKWIDDFFRMVEENLYKVQYRVMQARYRGRARCPNCHGTRLKPEALYVKVGGSDIAQLSDLPVSELKSWFLKLKLTNHEATIAKRILREIEQRLDTLLNVGLSYLTLNRLANSLSGGESQRIQLTKFLGSNLTDSLYILDEPSIGLHPKDTARLIAVLKRLRDLNNTVVVVEHDEMMMAEADHIIDMGPLAAHLGGEVIAAGSYREILHTPESLTGKYLSGRLKVEDFAQEEHRAGKKIKPGFLTIEGCRQHNLKDITVSFPLNKFCVVSGVSGSGKTTLVRQTLYPALQKVLGLGMDKPGAFDKLSGDWQDIQQVELVDQNPIGRSSRSNPVTYIKAYDEIRSLFAKQKKAKINGLEPKHFSFNVDGGRCDTCKGEGEVVVEMQFLADIHLKCESCKGKRFKDEVLEVKYHGRNIYEVLEMGVDEAIGFFEEEPSVVKKLTPLSEVGLGYIKLGQSGTTLSGGEAQRVKLASFLAHGKSQEKILFIFDEPTTGLHFHDINKLLHAFNKLLAAGHSLIIIEHNMDIIRNAEWIIDMGPEGGKGGGHVLYAGAPDGLKDVTESQTAKFL